MASVYVLCGEENYFKRKEIEKLKEKILLSNITVLNYETYEADEFALLKESLQSIPIFGKKLILIQQAEKINASGLEEVFLLAQKNENTALILNSDKRDFAGKIPSSCKAEIKIFNKVYARQLYSSLRQIAGEKGADLSTEAAEALIQNLGNNLQLLDLALDTLMNFVNNKRKIEKEDVRELIGLNAQEDVFKLMEAVAQKDIKSALQLLYGVLMSGQQAYQILGLISWHFARLITAKKIFNEYEQAEAKRKIQGIFSMKDYFFEKFLRTVNGFNFEQLKNAFSQLLEADEKIKTLSANPVYILETALVNLCSCQRGY